MKKPIKVRISTDKVRINTNELNLSQKKIVEYLLDNKRITNKEVQRLLGVKDSRALKILKEMLEESILIKYGKNRGSYYTLKDDDNMDRKQKE